MNTVPGGLCYKHVTIVNDASRIVSEWRHCLRVRLGAYPRVEHLKYTYSGRLRRYPQTLDEAGKACQGQTLKLNAEILKLRL